MTELKARPVVKNKFWIVEQDGEKIATIQAVDEGGYVYVHDEQRQPYANIKSIKNKLNVQFDRGTKHQTPATNEVYGFPASTRTYNCLFDVNKRLPIYTKAAKSKSYFCAGHYAVQFNNSWTKTFCPKLITLQRYEFLGPYRTKLELEQVMMENTNGSRNDLLHKHVQRSCESHESNPQDRSTIKCH
jgi:hypothetical protein